MTIKQIIFTEPNVAKLLDRELNELADNEVLVKTAYSTISAGTERANLVGDLNIDPTSKHTVAKFPRTVGYCSSGIVVSVGKNVTAFKPGDRVIGAWSKHASYNIFPEKKIAKIDDSISLSEAATCFISTFSLAGLTKTNPEFGESALICGLGILGIFAVQLARAMGLSPVIAVDPNPARRELAEKMGADYTFDPYDEDFVKNVKQLTNGGANIAVEVTGRGEALNQVLDCMARFGRVSLLGCTRDSDFTVDYYRKVHYPGITLVGAHTNARPENESRPGFHTEMDDLRRILKLLASGRLDFKPIISECYSPKECEEVFSRLAFDKNFPIGVQFDWSLLDE
ncbi:MAG: zinc-binding alcohol dehydrogenase [Clostridia bacterium]|nr:zinc-binding alcohol dehydrogenase [Clostridia bacterium]